MCISVAATAPGAEGAAQLQAALARPASLAPDRGWITGDAPSTAGGPAQDGSAGTPHPPPPAIHHHRPSTITGHPPSSPAIHRPASSPDRPAQAARTAQPGSPTDTSSCIQRPATGVPVPARPLDTSHPRRPASSPDRPAQAARPAPPGSPTDASSCIQRPATGVPVPARPLDTSHPRRPASSPDRPAQAARANGSRKASGPARTTRGRRAGLRERPSPGRLPTHRVASSALPPASRFRPDRWTPAIHAVRHPALIDRLRRPARTARGRRAGPRERPAEGELACANGPARVTDRHIELHPAPCHRRPGSGPTAGRQPATPSGIQP